jgi:hypothetical protein
MVLFGLVHSESFLLWLTALLQVQLMDLRQQANRLTAERIVLCRRRAFGLVQ